MRHTLLMVFIVAGMVTVAVVPCQRQGGYRHVASRILVGQWEILGSGHNQARDARSKQVDHGDDRLSRRRR